MAEKIYKPFGLKEYRMITQGDRSFLEVQNYLLELSKSGYIPKSGLIYDQVLNETVCKDKSVLDLGCGYLGILGFLAYVNKAKSVDSIDIDYECVEWFNKLIKDNNLDINCFYSNYYENIGNKKYDMILSNPPQMPMLSGSIHDTGGLDGRDYIMEIMTESISHLNDNGALYILLFDFLGIDYRTNKDKSIVEIARELGYSSYDILIEVEKLLDKGVTYDSIPYINSVYPEYDFGETDKKCKIKILQLNK